MRLESELPQFDYSETQLAALWYRALHCDAWAFLVFLVYARAFLVLVQFQNCALKHEQGLRKTILLINTPIAIG